MSKEDVDDHEEGVGVASYSKDQQKAAILRELEVNSEMDREEIDDIDEIFLLEEGEADSLLEELKTEGKIKEENGMFSLS